MAGKHAGPGDDTTGTLPILDGLLDAVGAELRNATERGASAMTTASLGAAIGHLSRARELIERGRGNDRD